MTPKNMVVEVVDDSEKRTGQKAGSFEVLSIKKVPLQKRMDAQQIFAAYRLMSFVNFAQKFSFQRSIFRG